MTLLKNRARRLLTHPFFPIGVIILVNLIIGVLVVTDYGESWDEQVRYNYANTALEAYQGDIKGARGQAAYLMIARIGSQALRSIWSSLRPMEAWHFMHFLSFQMGLVFLYLICRQLVGQWAAIGAVLLFNTQPLLWGHAWINPKDLPFMAFFLGSVALGLSMADSLIANLSTEISEQIGSLGGFARQLADEWRAARPGKRRLFVGLIVLSVGILVALVVARQPLQAMIANLITQAYLADPSSAIGRIFSRLTENVKAASLERYVQKSPSIYSRMVGAYAAFGLVFDLVFAGLSFPKTRGWIWRNWILPLVRPLPSLAANKRVLVAGLFLGLCASIRVLGPASGLMVAAYFLYKAGRKAIPGLIVYAAVAFIVLYATWPSLWTAPVQSYLESISKASDFPWDGKVMFGSVDYSIDDLPRSYLPVLLSLQFTETAMVMFLIGLLIAARDIIKAKINWEKPVLMALWFFLPILAVVIRHPTQYDNFRHFLFITPPIFIFAGIGLQAIFTRFKSAWMAALILPILVLPNIYWDVKLHPYQYIYYNSLTGGVSGAFRRYEMDYWATSYREATLYLNAFAPPGSRVVVWGADHIVKSYARQDLEISDYRKATAPQDFAIVSTRHNKDLSLYSGAPVLFKVGRDGAVFAVVKRLNPQDSP